VPTILL